MKKIFFILLKLYSKTESERLKIHEVLHEQVSKNYYEQTPFGNVYNGHIEFLMSSSLVKKLVAADEPFSLDMMGKGLQTAYADALKYLQDKEVKDKKETIELLQWIDKRIKKENEKRENHSELNEKIQLGGKIRAYKEVKGFIQDSSNQKNNL